MNGLLFFWTVAIIVVVPIAAAMRWAFTASADVDRFTWHHAVAMTFVFLVWIPVCIALVKDALMPAFGIGQ